jgi:hypothetical protein
MVTDIDNRIQRFSKTLDTEHPDRSRWVPMVTDKEERIQRFNKTLESIQIGAVRFLWSRSATVTVTHGFRCIKEKMYPLTVGNTTFEVVVSRVVDPK